MNFSKEEREKEKGLLQAQLQTILTKEIHLTQEILSKLKEQEYVLLTGDQIKQKNLQFILKQIEKEAQKRKNSRVAVIQQIIALTPEHKKGLSWEESFDSSDEEQWEIVTLLQHLQSLIQQMELQKKRNKALWQMMQRRGPTNLSTSGVQAKPFYSKKESQKLLLITIDFPEKENKSL